MGLSKMHKIIIIQKMKHLPKKLLNLRFLTMN